MAAFPKTWKRYHPTPLASLLNTFYVVKVGVCSGHSSPMEARGQLSGVRALENVTLWVPREKLGLSPWWWGPLPIEPSHWPTVDWLLTVKVFFLHSIDADVWIYSFSPLCNFNCFYDKFYLALCCRQIYYFFFLFSSDYTISPEAWKQCSACFCAVVTSIFATRKQTEEEDLFWLTE